MAKIIQQGALCCLAAVVLAGCAAASSGEAGGAQTVMVSAATKSEQASTFHISATEEMTPLSGTPVLLTNHVTVSGDVDLSKDSARITGTFVGASPSPGKTPQDITFTVIQIGNDSWESTGGLDGLLGLGDSPPPGHWIKDNPSSSVSQFPNPAKLFDALKSKATKVRFVGTATVDGVATNQYQLLGPPNLLDAVGGASSDQSEATGPVSIQVWVDRSNLVRRLSTALKENIGSPDQLESVTVSIDFTNYGEPVHIAPPPADLVLPNS